MRTGGESFQATGVFYWASPIRLGSRSTSPKDLAGVPLRQLGKVESEETTTIAELR